jgi:hypothetical protein
LVTDWLCLEADLDDAEGAVLSGRVQQWIGEELEDFAEKGIAVAEGCRDSPLMTESEVD